MGFNTHTITRFNCCPLQLTLNKYILKLQQIYFDTFIRAYLALIFLPYLNFQTLLDLIIR